MDWPFFEIEVPGKGPHTFEALGPFEAIELSEMFGKAKGKTSAAQNFAHAGVVLGKAWRSEPALESVQGDDIVQYGQDVLNELHRKGYTFPQITALVADAGMAMGREVTERADFSGAREAAAG